VHVGSPAPVTTAGDAVRLPLDGGWVATAWGEQLHLVAAALAALTGPAGERAIA
jgi:urease accessory protein